MQRLKFFAVSMGVLLLLAGCDMNKPPPGGELTEWALRMQAFDDLKSADHPSGPFESGLDSARAYLLEQLREKYGKEFAAVGKEKLENYGPLVGASYFCEAAPADAPEQITSALVSCFAAALNPDRFLDILFAKL